MKYVYLLRSLSNSKETYIGLTDNLNRRLEEHNAGKSPHTSRNLPWRIEVVVRFENDQKAADLERYLKSGSGHAFANRHLWTD